MTTTVIPDNQIMPIVSLLVTVLLLMVPLLLVWAYAFPIILIVMLFLLGYVVGLTARDIIAECASKKGSNRDIQNERKNGYE